jgi:hypothetical protein
MLKTTGLIVGVVGCVAVIGCGQAPSDEQLGSVELGLGVGGEGPVPFACFAGVGGNPPANFNIDAAADTQLEEALPTTSQGGLETCTMKGGSNRRHCLLRFDLTRIPTSATVQGACLRVFVTDPSGADYPAFQLIGSWNETEATWQQANLARTWELQGAWGRTDRGATPVATLPRNTTGWSALLLTASLVQKWVKSPASNYGIVFGNDSSYDGASIGTKENAGGITAQLRVWTGP